MSLTKEDLAAIEKLIKPLKDDVADIKSGVKEMKSDIRLLATINQLDEIKKNKRLMKVFSA